MSCHTTHIIVDKIQNTLYYVYVLLLSSQTFMTSLKQNSEYVRTNLKVLETLTYNCTSPDELEKLASKLDSLIQDFRAVLPKTEGLILRPQARLAARKRAKRVKHKYLNLTMRQKRGRSKTDWRYRNRVGQKAESFRKVCLYSVHVNTQLHVHTLYFIALRKQSKYRGAQKMIRLQRLLLKNMYQRVLLAT